MIDDCLKSDRNPHQKNAYKLEYTPRPYILSEIYGTKHSKGFKTNPT